jgi:Contractile injection system tube protein
MSPFMRGALVEFVDTKTAPVPNIVKFQFNPENLSRSINIPTRNATNTGTATNNENNQAGETPYEQISLTAHFSAADSLNSAQPGDPVAKYGVGPQLAALEKMIYPVGDEPNKGPGNGDRVANEVSQSENNTDATQPTPRHSFPNILFIWGENRVLPVLIESMSINEKQFDAKLNPVLAEVSLGLSVMSKDLPKEAKIASGAANYTNNIKENQAAQNLAHEGKPTLKKLVSF